MSCKLVAFAILAASLSSGCRGTNPSALQDSSAGTPALQQLEQTLTEWRDSWKTLNMTQEDWKETYSACHKNPATKDMEAIQKVAYCYLPIEFRICNTLFLKSLEKAGVTSESEKLRGFRECSVSSQMTAVTGKASDEKLYTEFFLSAGKTLPPDFRTRILKDYMPELSSKGFVPLVVATVKRYVQTHGGTDQAESDIERTITPAVEHPGMVAKIAKAIVVIGEAVANVTSEYFDLF